MSPVAAAIHKRVLCSANSISYLNRTDTDDKVFTKIYASRIYLYCFSTKLFSSCCYTLAVFESGINGEFGNLFANLDSSAVVPFVTMGDCEPLDGDEKRESFVTGLFKIIVNLSRQQVRLTWMRCAASWAQFQSCPARPNHQFRVCFSCVPASDVTLSPECRLALSDKWGTWFAGFLCDRPSCFP